MAVPTFDCMGRVTLRTGAVRGRPPLKTSNGKYGTAMGGFETSKAYRKRKARAMKREEARWAARSGPVTVTYRKDSISGPLPADD